MGNSPNGFSDLSASTTPDSLTKGKDETYGTPESPFFPLLERDHLHGNQINTQNFENGSSDSVYAENSRPSSSNASAKDKRNSQQRVVFDSDDCMIFEEVKPASGMYSGLDGTFVKSHSTDKFITPVRKRIDRPPSSLKRETNSGGVRKLSKTLPLEQEMLQKTMKAIPAHSLESHSEKKSSTFSMGKEKYSGLKETYHSSALGSWHSSKTSVTGKKETSKCKDAAEKIRDEKLELTKEKRMKLEKARTLSSKQKSAKTVKRSTRAQEKSMETRTRSREPKGGSGPETRANVALMNMSPRVTLHDVLPHTLGMPMWQPRVMLHRLSIAQEHEDEQQQEDEQRQQKWILLY